jgi:hypothetical protein
VEQRARHQPAVPLEGAQGDAQRFGEPRRHGEGQRVGRRSEADSDLIDETRPFEDPLQRSHPVVGVEAGPPAQHHPGRGPDDVGVPDHLEVLAAEGHVGDRRRGDEVVSGAPVRERRLGGQLPAGRGVSCGDHLLAAGHQPLIDDREQDGMADRVAAFGHEAERLETVGDPPRTLGIGEDRLRGEHLRVNLGVAGEPAIGVGSEHLQDLEVVALVVVEGPSDVEAVPAGVHRAELDGREHTVAGRERDPLPGAGQRRVASQLGHQRLQRRSGDAVQRAHAQQLGERIEQPHGVGEGRSARPVGQDRRQRPPVLRDDRVDVHLGSSKKGAVRMQAGGRGSTMGSWLAVDDGSGVRTRPVTPARARWGSAGHGHERGDRRW